MAALLHTSIAGCVHTSRGSGDDKSSTTVAPSIPAEQTKCPLTLKDMVKPMKSKICGHNYEQEAIMQHISRGRGRAKCPVCGQLLTKADLEHNAVLQNRQKAAFSCSTALVY